MPFKKLHSNIKEKLASLEIETPTPFQKKSIPLIKSGANLYCIAPKDSGKTTTIILTTLQRLKFEEAGSTPRAIIVIENNEKARELYELFLTYTRYSSLRVYLADERLHIDVLKSEIFEGVDILISSPKSLNKLILQNGVNTSLVKIFSIDDAEFVAQNPLYTAVMAIAQSVEKSQFVIYAEKMHPMLKRFEDYFMYHSRIITI